MEARSKIPTEEDREFFRRLARRWSDRSTAYIDRLEAVAETAENLRRDKNPEQFNELEERLRELDEELTKKSQRLDDLKSISKKEQETEERSNISTESDQQFLQRLARRWCIDRSEKYITQLEVIAEAAKNLVQNEKFEQLDEVKDLKELLRALEEFTKTLQ